MAPDPTELTAYIGTVIYLTFQVCPTLGDIYLVWKSSLVWTRGSQPGLILSPGDRRQCLEAFLIVMTRGCYWHRARMLLKVLRSDPTTENYPAHHVHSVRRRGSAVVVMSVDFAVECSHLQNGYNHTIYLIGLLRRFRELRTQDH